MSIKEIIKSVKATCEMGKIFENHIPDKELISRIYKTPIAQQKTQTSQFLE